MSDRTISASAANQSGVLVTGGGVLRLVRSKVRTSGNSSSSDQSSFCGLTAGVLANSKGRVTISGGSVVTSGAGANGVFAYGSGASATVSNATINATGQFAHGAMTAGGGGSVALKKVNISTAGGSSAPLATDRGGGTVTANGGAMRSTGATSPAIYSTGVISVTGAKMTATGSEGAVVEGANSITVTNSTLSGAVKRGVMLYSSMSGDARAGTGHFTMNGGALTAKVGPAFYITNTRAIIRLTGGVKVKAMSGTLIRADNAGTGSGNTGAGKAIFSAGYETLTGNLIAAGTGTITASFTHSKLTGMVNKAALRLDSSST